MDVLNVEGGHKSGRTCILRNTSRGGHH